jgi:predicted GNAT superfamily acetyltransferase
VADADTQTDETENDQQMSKAWTIKILEQAEEMLAVEELQRLVWPGSETEILPGHFMLASVHAGGLLLGAFIDERLVGFAYSFLAVEPGSRGEEPDRLRLKHHSHMLAVHPDYRSHGLGFALKRAQWQMVRRQGIGHITWTYDPLLSRNAWLNITRLGAVCSRYLENYYGEMNDELNAGLPSDRFEVDWWLNSKRVNLRLSRKRRGTLDLAHFLSAETSIVNPSRVGEHGWPEPPEEANLPNGIELPNIILVEIPADINGLKAAQPQTALRWRHTTRSILQEVFQQGYLVTDFVHLPGLHQRSFYALSHGEATF